MPFPNLNGRPSTYNEAIPEKVFEYIKECQQEGVPPTKAGFALYINTTKQTLLNWAEKSIQLFDALKKLDDWQENDLIKYSLNGKYNPTITKLLLQNNHGYSDKTDLTSGGKPIPIFGGLSNGVHSDNSNK